MDVNKIVNDGGELRAWTAEHRDVQVNDSRAYYQIADIWQRVVEASPVEGDRKGQPKWRASSEARILRRIARRARKSAADLEKLHTRHVRGYLELPERRQLEAARKAERKASGQPAVGAAGFVAKSLSKTASSLQSAPAVEQQPAAAAGAEGSVPPPRQKIADYFPPQQQGAGW